MRPAGFQAASRAVVGHGSCGRCASSAEQLGQPAALSQPSHEHFLPLLYAAGAAAPQEPVRFFNESFQGLSISMRSVSWG